MTMTDAPFSVTFKDAKGQLWTARGETFDEFETNAGLMQVKVFGGIMEVAVDNVVNILGQDQSLPAPDMRHNAQELQAQGQYETCRKCGSAKSKWVAPGVARVTGKPYAGFYGCSDPNCR